MKDTPTKNTMNILLLNIPFAVLGVAIAVVPLIIGMKHQARTEIADEVAIPVAFHSDHTANEYELAA